MPLIAPENVRWRLKQIFNGKIYEVNQTDNFMVGRSQNAQISLNSNKTSRTHSSFVVNIEGHLLVQDLKSINGTFVNGTQIAVYVLHRLYPGDTISFGISDINLSESDRDRQAFFEVNYAEPPNQTTSDELIEINSSADSKENSGILSIDSIHSSGRNVTAEINNCQSSQLQVSESVLQQVCTSTSDSDNCNVEIVKKSNGFNSENSSEMCNATSTKWLQKPRSSPKEAPKRRRSVNKKTTESSKNELEANKIKKRRHTVNDANWSEVAETKSSDNLKRATRRKSDQFLDKKKLQNEPEIINVDRKSARINAKRKNIDFSKKGDEVDSSSGIPSSHIKEKKIDQAARKYKAEQVSNRKKSKNTDGEKNPDNDKEIKTKTNKLKHKNVNNKQDKIMEEKSTNKIQKKNLTEFEEFSFNNFVNTPIKNEISITTERGNVISHPKDSTIENCTNNQNTSEKGDINKSLCTCQNPGTSTQLECSIHTISKYSEKSFTTDQDNSVIIDITDNDNDDDMDFSSSQIFHMSQIIKSEIEDDTYQKIKKELAEMDFCDNLDNPITINLSYENEMSGFENTQAICAYLENDSENNDKNDNLVSAEENEDLLNALENDNRSVNKELVSNEGSVNNEQALSITDDNAKSEILLKGIDCNNFFGKSEYSKPPIVEPHVEKQKHANDVITSRKDEKQINNNKRKQSLEVPFIKKKIKNSPKSVCEPHCYDSKSIQNEFKKRNSGGKADHAIENKERIREERRSKLKEIAERGTPTKTSTSKTDKGKTVKVLPESKTSRGRFLCEKPPPTKPSISPKTKIKDQVEYSLKTIDIEPLPTKPTKDQVEYKLKTVDLPKSNVSYNLRKTKSSGDIKADSINQLTAAQNRSNMRHSTAESCSDKFNEFHTKSDVRHKIDTIKDSNFDRAKIPVRSNDAHFKQPVINARSTNNSYQRNDRIPQATYDQSRRLMWTNGGSPYNTRKGPVIRLINVDDVIRKMVHWLPNWLLEQVDIDISAPINHPPATSIPLHFKSFQQYYETFSKLVLLENWQYLFKGFRESSEQPRKVQIEHVRILNDVMTLDCVCYINQKQLKQGLVYKPDDFVLLECIVNDKNNSYVSLNFGFIQNCKKTTISNNELISIKLGQSCIGEPHTKLEFCIITRYQPNREINQKKFPIVKVLANIRGHLMLIRAIKGLNMSPLCPKVLYPKMNEYKFPVIHTDIIQPHQLNPQQKTIVLEAASLCTGKHPGIYCIKGPPGTGKSTVIINLVMQILFSYYVTKRTTEPPMILLAAPSNTAVDNLLFKLKTLKTQLEPAWDKHKANIKCVRIGPESSINRDLIGYSLPKLAEKHVPLKNVESLPFKAARERNENMIEFSKRFFGNSYGHELKKCEDLIIRKSNIICTTLNSCINGKLIEAENKKLIKFTCCIIDEATQCHEVEALLPTILGIDKFVLVGDPRQLNATIMNKDAAKLGFGDSLFSRISNNFVNDPRTPIKMLTVQYRMHTEICSFPNRQFYEGKLRSSPKPPNKLPDNIKPYLVFNCEKANDSGDYTNIDEVHLIEKLLSSIIGMLDQKYKYSVGVITPYNAQKDLINNRIKNFIAENQSIKITVNTVDSFQGSENDIIIISCVRDSTNSFLQNPNRLNVALTRAKQALYIVGNYTLFKECRPLYDLREDAKKRRVLLDIRQNPLTIDNFSKYLVNKK